jgi:hypothetical protein
MAEATPLDRAGIEEAFRIVGQYLLDRKALGEIAIYGGSAILFQFDWRKTSQDVDARIVSEASRGLVIQAVREAAKRLGLSASWLNESVAMCAGGRGFDGPANRNCRPDFEQRIMSMPTMKLRLGVVPSGISEQWIKTNSMSTYGLVRAREYRHL